MSSAFEYRSNLKQKDIPKFIITGIMTELVFSDNFKIENEVSEFIDNVFRIDTKNFTNETGKNFKEKIVLETISKINSSDEKEVERFRKRLIKFVEKKFYNDEKITKSNNNLSKWVKNGQAR